MRVEWVGGVIGAAAGGVDEMVEYFDEKEDRAAPFKRYTDWTRVGLAALGYVAQMAGMMRNIAVPVSIAETTLVAKSVGYAIRNRESVSGQVTKVRRTTKTPASSGKVGWRPKAIGI